MGDDHHDDALAHASDLGREMDEYGLKQFISGYVNPFAREFGDVGTRAVVELMTRAAAAGMIPEGVGLDFVPHEGDEVSG